MFISQYHVARDGAIGDEVTYAIKEYVYNVVDGLRRYRYDADLELLLEVLLGRAPEEMHAKQMTMLENLRSAFVEADAKEHNGAIEGSLKRKSVPPILKKASGAPPDAVCMHGRKTCAVIWH